MFLHTWHNALATNAGRLRKLVMAIAVLGLSALMGFRTSPAFLVLLCGAGGLLGLLRQPAAGLVLMAALSFTLPLEFGTGSAVTLTPPVFLIPAIALAWLARRVQQGSLRLPASRTTLPLLLFVGSGLFSLLAGTMYWDPAVPRPGNLILVQLAQWAIFALSAALFLLAGDLGRDTRWLKGATWAFLILGSVVALEASSPVVRQIFDLYSPRRANTGMFWTWFAALAIGQLVFNRRLAWPARLALLGTLLVSAYVLASRTGEWVSGWAPFSVAAVTVIWLRIRRGNRALGWALLPVLAGAAVLVYPALFELAGGQQGLDMSWGGRLILYRSVFEIVQDHPLLGLGPAAYRHYGLTQSLSLGVGRALYLQPKISSHNNYIDIYAQMGLLGLGFFVWFLAELGLLGWRMSDRFEGGFLDGYVQGVLGGFVGTLFAMFLVDWFLPFVYNVGFPGFRTSALAWMFLGTLIALDDEKTRD
jgi:hypothetical protein